MELYLQQGHGMKTLACELSKYWNGTTIILSPKDIESNRLDSWCKQFKKSGMNFLFDPQLYYPKCNSEKIKSYSYWDSEIKANLINDSDFDECVRKINQYNEQVDTKAFLTPAFLEKYDENWLGSFSKYLESFVLSARKIVIGKPIYATIAIPSGYLLLTEDWIEKLLQILQRSEVDGYYIVAESYEHKYLISSEMWMTNLMNLCAGLKTLRRKVILGYASHQMIPLSCFKIDAIASGTFLNLRSFNNRFESEEGVRLRTVWIYYPHSMTEYKAKLADAFYLTGQWQNLPLDTEFRNELYVKLYQSVVSPSSIVNVESLTFKYYLMSLRKHLELLDMTSQLNVTENIRRTFTNAYSVSKGLDEIGMRGDDRSILKVKDCTLNSLDKVLKNRKFTFKMMWDIL